MSLNLFNGVLDRDGYCALLFDFFCELDYARMQQQQQQQARQSAAAVAAAQ